MKNSSGASSIDDQALLASLPEPCGLGPSGDDPSRVELHGALSFMGSKRGERYFQIEIAEPYFRSVFIIVYGDDGREGDDDLTDDIAPFDGNVATVSCVINQYNDLVTTPKAMRLMS